jgi:hypothetical protein
MKRHLSILALSLASILPIFHPSTLLAGHVWWRARDETTGSTEDADWGHLQSAITAAQVGSAVTGMVKISGNITRTNAAQPQLSITAGNVTISGGWNWPGGGAEPTSRAGRSTLDANSPTLGNARVMRVNAPDVTLADLVVTGGRIHGGGGSWGGGLRVEAAAHRLTITNLRVTANYCAEAYNGHAGGIGVDGDTGDKLQDFRIVDCEIDHNTSRGDSYEDHGAGGGIYIRGAGSLSHPVVIEHCNIQSNFANSAAGLYLQHCGHVLVANSRFTGNRSNTGAAVFKERGARLILFGCLVHDNIRYKGGAWGALHSYGYLSWDYLYVVNSTITGHPDGYLSSNADPYAPEPYCRLYQFINAVYSGDAGMSLAASTGERQHACMQASVFKVANFVAYTETFSTNWPSVGAALTGRDTEGNYRYHNLNDTTGAEENGTAGSNQDGDPGFLGSAESPGDPCQLAKTSRCIEAGVVRRSGTFTYVDVNHDGDYDALFDVIVRGTPPAGRHFVYTRDLLSSQRCMGATVDCGAYEWLPGRGTVILIY